MYLAVLAGLAGSLALARQTSPLDRMRPEHSAEVLAQKARDALRQLGYSQRPRDEAYGFQWNSELVEHVQANDKPAPRWEEVFSRQPSPLTFWYRQSNQPLTAGTFHTDLLTPGIVRPDDPPPIFSGMNQMELDQMGRLTFLEAIPPQRHAAAITAAPVDWSPLFALAGLDPAQLQVAEPLWTFLAAADTRAAWTGKWPESGRPLRVEAAALAGRPVAFMLAGPWRRPWRMANESPDPENATALMLFGLAILILGGAGLLARRNLRQGRGDRRGATRLAVWMAVVLMALWVSQVHAVASLGLLAMLLLAVCTSVFYGVLLWTIYMALEPFVRRYWPQVLVSWSNVLTGRVRDPVVGRDVLFGAALGIAWVLVLRVTDYWMGSLGVAQFPGEIELLSGLRSTAGVVLEEAPYAIRNVLFYFFLLFLLRVVLRSQWAAAIVFAGVFALLNALGNAERPWIGGLMGFVYFGSAAVAVLRWGLVSFAVGIFVSALLMDLPVTLDLSAWYFPNVMLLTIIVIALTTWGLYTSVGGRLWRLATPG